MTERFSAGPSPRWLQRIVARPGVIDLTMTQRLYARTAGWALQRLARADRLLTRFTTTDPASTPGGLLLARVPVVTPVSDPDPGFAQGATDVRTPVAGQDRPRTDDAYGEAPKDAASVAAPPALGVRLQRRVMGTGVVSIPTQQILGRATAGVSLHSGLHERLAARAEALPQAAGPPVGLALRVGSSEDPNETGRAVSVGARVAGSGGALAHRMPVSPPLLPVPPARGAPVPRDQADPLATPPLVSNSRSHTDKASIVHRKPADTAASATPLPTIRTDAPERASAGPDSQEIAATLYRPGTAARSGPARSDQIHTFAGSEPHTGIPSGPAVSLSSDPDQGTKPGSGTLPNQGLAPARPITTSGPAEGVGKTLTLARTPTDAPGDPSAASPVRPEAIPPAVGSRGSETRLQLAPARNEQGPAVSHAWPVAGIPTTAADSPQGSDWAASPSAVKTAYPGVPITTPHRTGTSSAPEVVHRAADQPLPQLQRRDPLTASAFAIPVGLGETAVAAGQPVPVAVGASARTTEMPPAPASATPTMVWRAADAGPHPASDRSSAAGRNTAMLMRSTADTDSGAGPSSSPITGTSMPSPAASLNGLSSAPASSTPMPDLGQLAEQVTRLIVRRLEVERDRRGGRSWP